MNINILLVLDITDSTLYPIDVFQNANNYMDIYKMLLSSTTLTQKDISIDEFVNFLTRDNKIYCKLKGYNVKDYILFYI